ncbi:hypothetical protein E2N92_00300 [Methanofollis formosanus]|uniref:Lipoprotein n=1 Tax=Methanofollis formosanus TaxID=299308 RepID=A0A8G0ZY46_9EURY|nr:hypothetical protein [Methanofollis formosanus]QYZ77975.1 hypothetical protein E2N92_00300 [Methanofollis formosanus]
MYKEKKILALLFSLAILGCTLFTVGCTTKEEPETTTPVLTPPSFQPDILDKPIINAPEGEGGLSPFLFEFDMVNASGFEAVRADLPGASTLVLKPNASATLPIIVSSEATVSTEIRVARTEGLPEGVQVFYTPDTFTLETREKTCLEMSLTSSENLNIPAETAVVVWIEGAGWEIGRAFYLESV